MNQPISDVNRSDQQTWVKSWNLPKGRVDLFLQQDGTIRADLSQNGRATDHVLNVIGINKAWTTSPQDLMRALNHTYATLSFSGKREGYLRISRQILGGGNGHSTEARDNYDSGSQDNRREDYTDYTRDDHQANAPSREDHDDRKSDAPAQSDSAENRTDSNTVDHHDSRGAADHHHDNHSYSHAADIAIEAGMHVAAHEAVGAFGGALAGLFYTSSVNEGENAWATERAYETNPAFREAIDHQAKEADKS